MKKILVTIGVIALIFLIGCIQKHPLVGESCGTVSPDARDECCARQMKDVTRPMCVGAWKYNPVNDQCEWVCKTAITNFEECAAAGNPIMESYPRQCRADGKTFVEVIEEPVQGPDQLIGGQRDEHGCLGPAGYSWDAEIGACIRTWELNENQRQAAKIAVATIGQQEGLTVVDVLVARCPGCFTVDLDKYQEKTKVELEDWKVKSVY
jgi:hypothetical protein